MKNEVNTFQKDLRDFIAGWFEFTNCVAISSSSPNANEPPMIAGKARMINPESGVELSLNTKMPAHIRIPIKEKRAVNFSFFIAALILT